VVERLRIAQLAPIAGPVRQDSQDSIEQLVWLLTEELVRRGHAVTLFASGDSETSATLHAVYPRGYEHDDSLWNYEFHEVMHAAAAFERAHQFDVIHSHVYHYALPFTRLVDTRVVHTYHTLPDPDVIRMYARYPEAHITAVSRFQCNLFCGLQRMPIIHHGVDAEAFPFNGERGDYLLFLGRLIPDKGPVEAVHIARAAGLKLVMAGPGDDYFRQHIAPLVDGGHIEYVGPVNAEQRNTLLAGAAALIYPLSAPEPFGLVMVEAMACGTPVLAYGRGAVPEIVDMGVTGYYADDLNSLVSLVPEVCSLDRARIREEAVARFGYRRMVTEYETLYSSLLANRRRRTA